MCARRTRLGAISSRGIAPADGKGFKEIEMKIDFRAGSDGNTTFLFIDGKQTITVWQTKGRTRACFVNDGKEIDLPAKNFALSSEEGRESLVAALLNAGALV